MQTAPVDLRPVTSVIMGSALLVMVSAALVAGSAPLFMGLATLVTGSAWGQPLSCHYTASLGT